APATALAAPRVGRPAPDFHATLYDGRKVSLADFKGQVLVLNFWATWCGPCKTELPLLNAFLAITQAHGLNVLAVASPDSAEPSALKPLAAKLAIPLVSRMSGPYGVLGGYPTNYVIDRAGVVRYARAGAFDLDALNAVIIPLLNEPAPAATTPVAAEAAPRGAPPARPTGGA
ncbi:MAG: TlpA family protein disulfide reductase, partial [Caulobacteraceae bacterium]|nr:TlpA family protein disulfide reductase [Caulobacter sp.]